uniref:Uncharacterized protein n=1 Tax=Brassica campestris TaxID=3711 RepID=M4FBY7_BRACM
MISTKLATFSVYEAQTTKGEDSKTYRGLANESRNIRSNEPPSDPAATRTLAASPRQRNTGELEKGENSSPLTLKADSASTTRTTTPRLVSRGNYTTTGAANLREQTAEANDGSQNQRWKQSGESMRRPEKQRENGAERRKPSGAGTRTDAPPGRRRRM